MFKISVFTILIVSQSLCPDGVDGYNRPSDCDQRTKMALKCFDDLMFVRSAPPTSVQELEQNYCSSLDEKLACIVSHRACYPG